jgi:hypothetical protein
VSTSSLDGSRIPRGQEPKPLALVVCGALMKEVQEVANARGWSVDLHGVPARLHTQPQQILSAVESMLDQLAGRYERIVVVYGDCGTAGALDSLLEARGVRRVPGPHCYVPQPTSSPTIWCAVGKLRSSPIPSPSGGSPTRIRCSPASSA